MTRLEFLTINDQPCRIKLRTGTEVFGVIREKGQPGNEQYYFSTLNERYNRLGNSIGMMVNLEDIAGAELLSSTDSLVG